MEFICDTEYNGGELLVPAPNGNPESEKILLPNDLRSFFVNQSVRIQKGAMKGAEILHFQFLYKTKTIH
jgi:hypothetical protein